MYCKKINNHTNSDAGVTHSTVVYNLQGGICTHLIRCNKHTDIVQTLSVECLDSPSRCEYATSKQQQQQQQH